MRLPAHKTLPDVESKRAEKTKCFLSFLSARAIVRVTQKNCRNEIFRKKGDLAEFRIPFFSCKFLFAWAGCCFGDGFFALAGTRAYGSSSWEGLLGFP